ncbi:MAG: hypothetical protein JNN05_05960 [Candidatus Omnitrophica bacterium]|nr:hypothetical protein [Candidatus Omnitrophota bacterium]
MKNQSQPATEKTNQGSNVQQEKKSRKDMQNKKDQSQDADEEKADWDQAESGTRR